MQIMEMGFERDQVEEFDLLESYFLNNSQIFDRL